jgi:release factor glutamine methyltransferase
MYISYEDLKFMVLESVYKPAEDTYLLISAIAGESGGRALDLGCGCGLISLILAKRFSEVIAVDINPDAVRLTVYNARINGLSNVYTVRCDSGSSLKSCSFDVVACNPPYIPVLDEGGWIHKAWSGGLTGREATYRMAGEAYRLLKEDGRLYIVASSLSKIDYVENYLRRLGFKNVKKILLRKLFFEELVVIKCVK